MKAIKILRYITIILLTTSIFTSCTKDPYDGVKSNERSIEAITLGSGYTQVGPAVVDRTTGTVTVKVLMEANTDLSKVAPLVQASYKAEITPASGEVVNFAAGNNKATYIIISEAGQTREWTVELVPFTETIIGTYDIKGLVVYGGTGVEYGGGGVLNMTDKPWVWPSVGGPQSELDNHLTFAYTGVTSTGNTFGTITNNAGTDGKYANFLFTSTPQTDVNSFYRKIPKGEGKWERNYSTNTVTFTFADGSTSVGVFELPKTEDLGNGLTKKITDNSFSFILNGSDDWGNIYSDLDKFVKKPRKFWIDVKKQN